jgi:hypothetical protein
MLTNLREVKVPNWRLAAEEAEKRRAAEKRVAELEAALKALDVTDAGIERLRQLFPDEDFDS